MPKSDLRSSNFAEKSALSILEKKELGSKLTSTASTTMSLNNPYTKINTKKSEVYQIKLRQLSKLIERHETSPRCENAITVNR